MCQEYDNEHAQIVAEEHAATVRGFASAYFGKSLDGSPTFYIDKYLSGYSCVAKRQIPYALELVVYSSYKGDYSDWLEYKRKMQEEFKKSGNLPEDISRLLKSYVRN